MYLLNASLVCYYHYTIIIIINPHSFLPVTPHNSPLDLRIIGTYRLVTLIFDPQQDIYRQRTTEILKKHGHQHPLLDSKGLSARENTERNLDNADEVTDNAVSTAFLTRNSTVYSCDSTSACWVY